MKKLFIALTGLIMMAASVMAQNEAEVLRFSHMNWGGTARSQAVGGAISAFGADFSSLSMNPAGIGLYKRSEITFTPQLHYSSIESKLDGAPKEDYRYNFNINSVGWVIPIDLENGSMVHFGLGINRLYNFNHNYFMKGFNNNNSMMTAYVDYANRYGLDGVSDMAWQTYLMDQNAGGTYVSDLYNGGVLQQKVLSTSGSANEFVVSFGGNIEDKLFLGATLGIPYFSYEEEATYTETDSEDQIASTYDFKKFTDRTHLEQEGVGVNFKLGVLYQPVDFIRTGVAIHTPTFYDVDETYHRDLSPVFADTTVSPYGMANEFDYEIITPFRFMYNLAFIIGQYGFVGFDYEFADYRTGRIRAHGEDFSDVTEVVKDVYSTVHSFRVGGELNLKPFALRAGYAFHGNPYKDKDINDGSYQSISAGAGVRGEHFFADFAFTHNFGESKYYFYEGANAVTNTLMANTFTLTLGCKF